MNRLVQVPKETLIELLRYIEPCELLENSMLSKQLRTVFTDRELLRFIALDRGLPFSDSLNKLCEFERMNRPLLLKYAASTNDVRVAEYLLNSRYRKVLRLNGALRKAAKSDNNLEVAKLLLENGADGVNRAMEVAARRGNIRMVELMLSNGADNYDESAIEAVYGGHPDIVEIFLQLSADQDEIMIEAAGEGDIEIVRLALEYGAIEYVKAADEAAAGEADASSDGIPVIELMMEQTEFSVDDFRSIMDIAANAGNVHIVKFALDHGADNFDGTLLSAARSGDIQIAQMMIDLGATDFDGALNIAVNFGRTDIVKLLLKHPISQQRLNSSLKLAIARNHIEIARLLMDNGAEGTLRGSR